jgi:hypothetical protein
MVPEFAGSAETAQLDHRQGKIEPVALGLLYSSGVGRLYADDLVVKIAGTWAR